MENRRRGRYPRWRGPNIPPRHRWNFTPAANRRQPAPLLDVHNSQSGTNGQTNQQVHYSRPVISTNPAPRTDIRNSQGGTNVQSQDQGYYSTPNFPIYPGPYIDTRNSQLRKSGGTNVQSQDQGYYSTPNLPINPGPYIDTRNSQGGTTVQSQDQGYYSTPNLPINPGPYIDTRNSQSGTNVQSQDQGYYSTPNFPIYPGPCIDTRNSQGGTNVQSQDQGYYSTPNLPINPGPYIDTRNSQGGTNVQSQDQGYYSTPNFPIYPGPYIDTRNSQGGTNVQRQDQGYYSTPNLPINPGPYIDTRNSQGGTNVQSQDQGYYSTPNLPINPGPYIDTRNSQGGTNVQSQDQGYYSTPNFPIYPGPYIDTRNSQGGTNVQSQDQGYYSTPNFPIYPGPCIDTRNSQSGTNVQSQDQGYYSTPNFPIYPGPCIDTRNSQGGTNVQTQNQGCYSTPNVPIYPGPSIDTRNSQPSQIPHPVITGPMLGHFSPIGAPRDYVPSTFYMPEFMRPLGPNATWMHNATYQLPLYLFPPPPLPPPREDFVAVGQNPHLASATGLAPQAEVVRNRSGEAPDQQIQMMHAGTSEPPLNQFQWAPPPQRNGTSPYANTCAPSSTICAQSSTICAPTASSTTICPPRAPSTTICAQSSTICAPTAKSVPVQSTHGAIPKVQDRRPKAMKNNSRKPRNQHVQTTDARASELSMDPFPLPSNSKGNAGEEEPQSACTSRTASIPFASTSGAIPKTLACRPQLEKGKLGGKKPPAKQQEPASDISPNQATAVSSCTEAVSVNPENEPPLLVSVTRPLNIDTLLGAAQRNVECEVPLEGARQAIYYTFNNLNDLDLSHECNMIRYAVRRHLQWVTQYLVMEHASRDPDLHEKLLETLDLFRMPEFNESVLSETLRNIKVLLRSNMQETNINDQNLLKNLGKWLGMLTLRKNQPILQIDVDLKALLCEAYFSAGLKKILYIIPFVVKILESCAESKVFKPPNPWTKAILRVLVVFVENGRVNLNLEFEIKMLLKKLGIGDGDLDYKPA